MMFTCVRSTQHTRTHTRTHGTFSFLLTHFEYTTYHACARQFVIENSCVTIDENDTILETKMEKKHHLSCHIMRQLNYKIFCFFHIECFEAHGKTRMKNDDDGIFFSFTRGNARFQGVTGMLVEQPFYTNHGSLTKIFTRVLCMFVCVFNM